MSCYERYCRKIRVTKSLLIAMMIWCCVIFVGATLSADDSKLGPDEFFEKRIRPVLAERCYECHSEANAESELRVDGRDFLLEGGTRGPAVIPNDPQKSLLILAVNHADTLHMPPKQKLPAREIVDLTEWVKIGAPWPGSDLVAKVDLPKPSAKSASGKKERKKDISPEELDFWAFKAPQRFPVPAPQHGEWCQSPIDAFVAAKMDAANLAPSPTATARQILRRLSFDLTGLAPTSEQTLAFLADKSPDAIDRVIDRMLASPQYGERWGRRWLDVARYADSNGLDENLAYASAFRYRDYVIAAFNKDKPYDRFVTEQIAGDLVGDPVDVTSYNECLTATGFLSVGAKMLAEDDPVKMQMDIIDEQIDTIGQTILGMTLGCARCHDHKYDPVRLEDYYALAGIFKSTKTMENFRVVARWQERPLGSPELVKKQEQIREQVGARKGEIDRLVDIAANELIRASRLHVGDYLFAASESKLMSDIAGRSKSVGVDPMSATPETMIVEAENFQRGNVKKDFDTYGKEIGVLVNLGPTPNFVEYDLEVPHTGLYQFEIRYAAAAARPCKLIINGRLEKDGIASKTTGSWTPETQTWHVDAFVSLPKGKSTLRIENPQAFPHIDKFLLTPTTLPADVASELHATKTPGRFAPIPELVTQWAKMLEDAAADSNSLLQPWIAAVRGSPLSDSESPAVRQLLARLDGAAQPLTPAVKPKSLVQLAEAYNHVFGEAVNAWESLKNSEGGRTAEALPDAFAETLRKFVYDPKGGFARPKTLEPHFSLETKASLQQVRDEVAKLEKSIPQLPEAMAVSDGAPEDLRVHLRGSHVTQGEMVHRGFPRAFGEPMEIEKSHSGRLELARWLTRNHPLTSRVMINRIWAGHFSIGLVRSHDNFGQLGERPTAPELLDWLATRFVDDGWSIKRAHRLMLLSSTFALDSRPANGLDERDPENHLLTHFNRRRLEAEEVRDSVIQLGQGLDETMTGTLLPTGNRQYVTSTANVNPVIYDTRRRSVYLPIIRSAVYEVFQAFDFPDPSTLHGARESTTVASQALFMMNSSLVSTQTKSLAERLLSLEESDEHRVSRVFLEVLGRDADSEECAKFLRLVNDATAKLTSTVSDPLARRVRGWQIACRTLLSSNEFLYVD